MDPAPQPAVLARIIEVLGRPLQDDENLVASLQAVATSGCSLIQGCSAASITILDDDKAVTIASTDARAVAIDQAQYEVDAGPCLDAARERRVIVVGSMDGSGDWPRYRAAAEEHGIHSSLSVPLILAGPGTAGGLNLYGAGVDAFDDDDQQLASVFALQASTVVTNAMAYWAAFEQSRHLTMAMESRAQIEQAKGILMASQRCGPEEAFDLLRRASQRENRKLRDIAAEIVERASSAGETPDGGH